jgi:5-epi-valiolone dehydratase
MVSVIVGAGFIGQAIGCALTARGEVTLASRRRPPGELPWLQLDVLDDLAWQEMLGATQPEVLVLAHGPSDISWCEVHPALAMRCHAGAARAASASTDAWTLLISTDNVFDGRSTAYSEASSPAPQNAYGRAKLIAERAVLEAGGLVLRVSLVYGWPAVAGRENFFSRAVRQLSAGQPVHAPTDHWNTPVLIDDLVRWTDALVCSRRRGVLHLGGPDRVSREQWARCIARELELPHSLIVSVPKAQTEYACRPANACLTSIHAPVLDELRELPPVGVAGGAAALRGRALQTCEPARVRGNRIGPGGRRGLGA